MKANEKRAEAFLSRVWTLAGAKDMERIKAQMDRSLLAGSYADIEYVALLLTEAPEVASSGATAPETDLDGNALQDLGELEAPLYVMGFTLFPTDSGGAAVFSWVKGESPPRRFVESLLRVPAGLLPSALVHTAFEFFDNTYVSPTWWAGLSSSIQEDLARRAHRGIPHFEDQRVDLLVPKEPLPIRWQVRDIVRSL